VFGRIAEDDVQDRGDGGMKIFFICPVRLGIEDQVTRYMKYLENYGHEIYYPPRDTNQVDVETGGYRICKDNLAGILWSDEVHIWYRGDSQGIHFDMGMAFALNKRVKILNPEELYEHIPEGYSKDAPKSYPKMLQYWELL